MNDLYQIVKNLTDRLEYIDVEIWAIIKKIEQSHEDSDLPLKLRKQIQHLIDSKKDLSDRVQDLKGVLDNSRETLEQDVDHLLKELSHAIKKLSDELD